jgi:hypothetical protein
LPFFLLLIILLFDVFHPQIIRLRGIFLFSFFRSEFDGNFLANFVFWILQRGFRVFWTNYRIFMARRALAILENDVELPLHIPILFPSLCQTCASPFPHCFQLFSSIQYSITYSYFTLPTPNHLNFPINTGDWRERSPHEQRFGGRKEEGRRQG